MSTYTFENVTSNQTISAEFEKLKFTISVISDVGGTINPGQDIVLEYGQNKIFVIWFTIVNSVLLNQKFILNDPYLYYFREFFGW